MDSDKKDLVRLRVMREYNRRDTELTYQAFKTLEASRKFRRLLALWLLIFVALAVAMTMLSGCVTEPTSEFSHNLNDSLECLDRSKALPEYCEED